MRSGRIGIQEGQKKGLQKNLRQKNGGLAGNAAIFLPEIFLPSPSLPISISGGNLSADNLANTQGCQEP